MEDRNSLEYLIALREKYQNRYKGKQFKPCRPETKAAEVPQRQQIKFDYPLNGFSYLCGGLKDQADNL